MNFLIKAAHRLAEQLVGVDSGISKAKVTIRLANENGLAGFVGPHKPFFSELIYRQFLLRDKKHVIRPTPWFSRWGFVSLIAPLVGIDSGLISKLVAKVIRTA